MGAAAEEGSGLSNAVTLCEAEPATDSKGLHKPSGWARAPFSCAHRLYVFLS